MAEAYIVDAVRTPVGRARRRPVAGPPRRPRRARRSRRWSSAPASTRRRRRRRLRLRRHDRPAGRRHRPHLLARRRAARGGARARPSTGSAARRSRPCTSPRRRVMSGTQDLVVAGGVQNMSAIPISVGDDRRPSSSASTTRSPAREGWRARYGDQEVSQFRGAEMIAEKWDISREDMEAFALRVAPARRSRASDEGRFEREIVAARRASTADEGPRATPTSRRCARCAPLVEGGRLTAAVSSARSPTRRPRMLIASRDGGAASTASRRGPASTTSRVRGDDPIWMLTAPIPATAYALEQDRHDARRHRPRRDQRGVRLGRAGLAEGDRRRPGEGQRQRRRDRARPPARRHRRPADDDAAATSSSAPAAATACRRCARAAARPTSPSSSGSASSLGFTREELARYEGATVPDLVGDGLRLLFVGINPGLWTAATQTHFSHPGNRFYPALARAGIFERRSTEPAG